MEREDSSSFYDLAIIGCGPAGAKLAVETLKRSELRVVVLEEDEVVGRPVHCAGLISLKGLRIVVGPAYSDVILNSRIRGAKVFSPSGKCVFVDAGSPIAAAVDRAKLDAELAAEAEGAGAEIRLGCEVRRVYRRRHYWVLSISEGGYVRARYLAVATGVKRRILRELGFSAPRVIPALQYELEGVSDVDPEFVEVYLDRRYSDEFFAWLIPLSEDRVRVGLASRGSTLTRLRFLLEKSPMLAGRVSRARRVRVYGGGVVVGGIEYELTRGCVLRIGDAAGQTKPTTGGGVVYIGLASKAAAEALAVGNLRLYELAWRRVMGGEIRVQMAARKIFSTLDNDALELLVRTLSRESDTLFLGREMDAQAKPLATLASRLLKSLLSDPAGAMRLLLCLVKSALSL